MSSNTSSATNNTNTSTSRRGKKSTQSSSEVVVPESKVEVVQELTIEIPKSEFEEATLVVQVEKAPPVNYWKEKTHPIMFAYTTFGDQFKSRWTGTSPRLVAAHARSAGAKKKVTRPVKGNSPVSYKVPVNCITSYPVYCIQKSSNIIPVGFK